ncbi:hypothetical protein KUTeg_015947 [Tegillarca granosa]|uniref:NADH dehydrogenase [ubiquinone] 1 alpha subcomplex subunit 11 n=1 Tax=Tegillarca granosa TaxID=220873 RepID=A0ABQ9EN94_TEGGR|nr:hypothetical protein KUTeg_015947 [Tegillarca granosa]
MSNILTITSQPARTRESLVYKTLSSIWWETDGQNITNKIKNMTKFGAVVGTLTGILGVGVARPRFFYGGISVFTRCFVPITAAGATYAIVTNTLGMKRGKSDRINHAVGGFLAGAISGGGIARNYKLAFISGFTLCIFAACLKTYAMENMEGEGQSTFYSTRN